MCMFTIYVIMLQRWYIDEFIHLHMLYNMTAQCTYIHGGHSGETVCIIMLQRLYPDTDIVHTYTLVIFTLIN